MRPFGVLLVLAVVALAAAPVSAKAPAPIVIKVANGIFDMVYDTQRGVLCMTTGSGGVLRYQMSSQTFLPPLKIGGNLEGIDISADNGQLAIGDRNSGDGKVWVDDYDLATDKLVKIAGKVGSQGSLLGGTFDAAFDANGLIAVSGALAGGDSGAGVPMFIADPQKKTLTQVSGQDAAYLTEETILQASPDHSVVTYTAGDISNGPWGVINTGTATLKMLDATNWFTYSIAAAPHGRFFAVPTYGGTFVFNHAGLGLETLGTDAQTVFVGAAFDPIRPALLYQTLAGSDVIQVYNVRSQALIRSYHTGVTVPWNGNSAFAPGYLRIASDGSYIFMKTSAGAVAVKLR
jgi:hypothetical protein